METNNSLGFGTGMGTLQPAPTPSYIVSSPYTSIYPPATSTASNG